MKDKVIVDIRGWEEHIGKTSGYEDLVYKGRIPTSKWGKAGSNPGKLEYFRNNDGTMRDFQQVLNGWMEGPWSIDIGKTLIFYCGTGWRAAEVWVYAKQFGLKDVHIYDFGFYEWSHLKNEVELGEVWKESNI